MRQLTIAIPAYNSENYVQKCIDSMVGGKAWSCPADCKCTGDVKSHNYITNTIQKVCADANIPIDKVSPRRLKKLCQTARSGIEANISVLKKTS